MRDRFRTALAVIGLTAAGISLSSCNRPDRHPAASRPAPAKPAIARPAPAGTFQPPATRNETVWRLRAGLNVAALSCRGKGRRPVAGDYGRMLARHRELLAAAYRQEQRRQGASAFDRQQTRLYNRFANQRSPERFCHAASGIAQRANGLSSAGLVTAAPSLLAELEAPLVRRP